MIDRTGITVTDYDKGEALYSHALNAIGYRLPAEIPACQTNTKTNTN